MAAIALTVLALVGFEFEVGAALVVALVGLALVVAALAAVALVLNT